MLRTRCHTRSRNPDAREGVQLRRGGW
jgi:hypothetical protein